MKIFITGITGLLGSYVAREFADLGEIHGLKRTSSSTRLLDEVDFPIIWHEGDLSDQESLEHFIQGMDLVIHAAGLVSFDSRDSDALMEVNVQGTANLVNAMLNAQVSRLIHVSSVAAIGRSSGISQIDEKFKWVESSLNTDYAISKYGAELEAWRGEQEGLELLVVNPSILLGKIADERSSTTIYDYVLEEHGYYPTGHINYLDVRDAARMIRGLYEKNAWGQRFILNAASIPYQEFFQKMAEIFSKKAPSKKASGILLKFAVILAGLGRTLGISKNPLNKKTAMISTQKISFDNQKATRLLAYEYRSLEDTFSWAK